MDDLDCGGLLERLGDGGFETGERVILGHSGTVQTLLSLIFGVQVTVELLRQRSEGGVVSRQVALMAGDTAVCFAASRIPEAKNRADILRYVLEGKVGLGQIIALCGIATARTLAEAGRNSVDFWRAYAIEGPGLCFEVQERYPRAPFEQIGWLTPDLPGGRERP